MPNWSIETIDLPLKFDWKISRSSTDFKQNLIIKVEYEGFVGLGEVAPNTRYLESVETIQGEMQRFVASRPQEIVEIHDLAKLLDELELKNSLRFGIESAYVHFLAQFYEKEVTKLIHSYSKNVVPTSFSIPIMDIGKVSEFFDHWNLKRFPAIKIKISSEELAALVSEVRKKYQGPLRIDANEAFTDADTVLRIFEKLSGSNIEMLEQPLPASMWDDYLYLKRNLGIPLAADESVTDTAITADFISRFDIVNIKLMKSGGYLNAVSQCRKARDHGLKIMLGCMVETSLGISSALNLAGFADFFDLDGSLLLKDDPFNLIEEENGRILKSGTI